MGKSVTEIIRDIDGSVLTVCKRVILMEGIEVKYYMEPGANRPHEIALQIGDNDAIEMRYSDALKDMFDGFSDVSMVDLLKAIYENLWQPKAEVA